MKGNRCCHSFIGHIHIGCFSNIQCYIVSFCINRISCRNGDFFQIYNFLCLLNRNFCCTIDIRCRHLFDQLCTCSIAIDTINRTGQSIRCLTVFFHDRNITFLGPCYFEIHILFISDTFTKYQCKILCGRSCCYLIGRILFINASFHL